MSLASLERGADGTLRLAGALDFANAPVLWRQGRAIFEAGGAVSREIDLAAVERTDSAGVALLIDWTRQARAQGGNLRLRHVPQQMLAIVQASGVQAVFDIADDPA